MQLMTVAVVLTVSLSFTTLGSQAAKSKPPEGYVSIFNGRDLAGWIVPLNDNGHWKVVNGVI
jgi:hypothetical protein